MVENETVRIDSQFWVDVGQELEERQTPLAKLLYLGSINLTNTEDIQRRQIMEALIATGGCL